MIRRPVRAWTPEAKGPLRPNSRERHLVYAERTIANAVRTRGFFAQAFDLVGFVLFIVALEEVHATVAFEGHDMRGNAIEEPAVVTDHEHASGKLGQRILERA